MIGDGETTDSRDSVATDSMLLLCRMQQYSTPFVPVPVPEPREPTPLDSLIEDLCAHSRIHLIRNLINSFKHADDLDPGHLLEFFQRLGGVLLEHKKKIRQWDNTTGDAGIRSQLAFLLPHYYSIFSAQDNDLPITTHFAFSKLRRQKLDHSIQELTRAQSATEVQPENTNYQDVFLSRAGLSFRSGKRITSVTDEYFYQFPSLENEPLLHLALEHPFTLPCYPKTNTCANLHYLILKKFPHKVINFSNPRANAEPGPLFEALTSTSALYASHKDLSGTPFSTFFHDFLHQLLDPEILPALVKCSGWWSELEKKCLPEDFVIPYLSSVNQKFPQALKCVPELRLANFVRPRDCDEYDGRAMEPRGPKWLTAEELSVGRQFLQQLNFEDPKLDELLDEIDCKTTVSFEAKNWANKLTGGKTGMQTIVQKAPATSLLHLVVCRTVTEFQEVSTAALEAMGTFVARFPSQKLCDRLPPPPDREYLLDCINQYCQGNELDWEEHFGAYWELLLTETLKLHSPTGRAEKTIVKIERTKDGLTKKFVVKGKKGAGLI
eukprot:CAMPEP_0174258178 /NCGR_PEP_ID=MMETSP0439-20130205/7224_1 /TAXON_ID=0 /ORGANISM="Stereomyxa ramosa, Strain Chinc5" /LENGTH=550 /DNA_ID=CAMNT_0015341591 /DNA_START=823 /DNA_END=2472 /DNA_ORIENTATION=-